jgi:hypothetical protein
VQSPLPILIGGNNKELVRCGGRVASVVELTGLGRFPGPDVISSVPFVMIGSTTEIVDELHRRRERWGFTRYTVRWPQLEALIPVLRRLDALGELAI